MHPTSQQAKCLLPSTSAAQALNKEAAWGQPGGSWDGQTGADLWPTGAQPVARRQPWTCCRLFTVLLPGRPWSRAREANGHCLFPPCSPCDRTVGLLGYSSLQMPWRLHQCWGCWWAQSPSPWQCDSWGAIAIVGPLRFAVGRSPKAHARFWDVISWETWACWTSEA